MKTKYIAAVDFGTSRTGFAWCSSGEITGTSDIFIKKAWPGLLSEYVKTYTELYYDSQHNKWYFGGEARKIRLTGKNFEGNNVRGEHFQEYKMNLYDTGKTYDINKTIDLIAETLKIMKELVFENMRDNFGDTFFSREMFDKETLWVLTVPEGATDDNKACMREAAVKAGLIEKGSEDFERLVFALEPEAGIIACIKDDIAQSLIDNEQVIVVFDAGGGTVDITVKKFCPPKDGTPAKLSSIENVTGACEPAGSKYMDECFFKYLSNLFGNEILDKLLDREEYIDDYQEIVMNWINGKEFTAGYNNGESFDFRINIRTLWEILENISSDEYKSLMNEIDKSPERIIIRNNYEYKFDGRKNQYLEFNRKIFETTFHKIFEKAYMPLKRTLEQLKEQNIKCDSLFFIGGFSCNPCLREFIKKQISKDFEYMDKIRYVEMNSDKTSSAVLFGAVLYAADPGFITDRIAKLTYGVDCFINGEENCFSALISRGDKISMETKYIAAVDFGNSRTGFAWCISGQVTGIQDIYIQKKWPGLSNEYAKTYTELFYDSQLDKWYFGGEAHQIRFTGKNFEGNYVKGEHFQEYKKELYYISQGYSEGGDSLEKQYDKTMDLIVETLKVMKKFIWEDMNEKLGAKLSQENFEQDVQWVLAVPESATKSYRDYMRKAAIKAGLIKEKNKDFERLVFISEPDAAIITSINDGSLKNMPDDKDEKIIIVFDAGSEMVRASVKKWCPDNFGLQKLSSIEKVCEVYEPAGVKYIDNCFFNYLLNLFGTRVFDKLLNKYRDDYNNIATGWANGKENITSYSSGENFEIEIDISALWKILEDISPDEYKLLINEINKNPERMINRNNYKYVFSGQYNRYLIINRGMFEFIFHKVFENAYLPLKKVLKKLDAQDIKCDNLVLLFTGGFSRNPCLKEFIDKQVSNDYFSRLDKIRYVQNTVYGEIKSNREGAAVLFGAVLLGVYNVLYKQYIQIGEDIKMLCKRHKKLQNYATQLENRYMEFEDGQWIQKLYLKRLGTLFGKQYKFKEFTIELQQFQQRYKELIENAKFLKQQYKGLKENAKFLKQRYNQFMDNIIHSSLLQKEYKEFSYNVVQLDKGYKSFRNKEFVFALGDRIINFLKF